MNFFQPNFYKFFGRKPDGKGIIEVKGWIEDDKFWAEHSVLSPEKMKVKFYNQKILHALYPNNFPDFERAGVKFTHDKRAEFGFSIRELVKTRKMGAETAKRTLYKIQTEVKTLSGLILALDLVNPTNYCTDEKGNHVYLDTVEYFVKSPEDIQKLMELVAKKGIQDGNTSFEEIESYAKRAAENYMKVQNKED